MFTLHATNFRVLRHFCWPLRPGVSVLSGANGSGKTTTLLLLKVLRAAFDRGLPEAISAIGGSHNLRNHEAASDEPIEIGIDVADLSWRVRLVPRGATVDYVSEERLARRDETIVLRDALGNFFYRGERKELGVSAARQLALRWSSDNYPDDQEIECVAEVVRRIQVFYDPDIRGLRESGSKATENRHLHTHGRNVLTMLRDWRDRREDRVRFDFVDRGLRTAFPSVYDGMDFESGQTISARIYRPGDEMPIPIWQEANGVLMMMVHLAEVASADRHGFVAIDEPETAQHPFAIRCFLRAARAWAKQRDVSIVLTTHSPVLLDEFRAEPECISVLERLENRDENTLPVQLDKLHDREWLATYTLGELYVAGEFAANE
ncbi:MAG: AAA family ATPase [Polyangiaceae bacterium]|nr:AAA family ATPase [Polyangiaceae bacterium]